MKQSEQSSSVREGRRQKFIVEHQTPYAPKSQNRGPCFFSHVVTDSSVTLYPLQKSSSDNESRKTWKYFSSSTPFFMPIVQLSLLPVTIFILNIAITAFDRKRHFASASPSGVKESMAPALHCKDSDIKNWSQYSFTQSRMDKTSKKITWPIFISDSLPDIQSQSCA
jgi:hypothetical protein